MLQTFAVADQPRGCGESRKQGGAYAEVGFSEFGSPLESFVFDPILKCDVEQWGLSPLKPKLIEAVPGRFDVLDWIGEVYYPNPADFLEEVRRLGLSRRLELSKPEYDLLSQDSRITIVLPKAYIEPELLVTLYLQELHDFHKIGYEWKDCPRERHTLTDHLITPCASYLWRRTDVGIKAIEEGTRYVERKMPAFSYNAVKSCDQFLDADPVNFSPGFVASFKIGRIAVVRDSEGQTHKAKIEKLSECSIRVDEVDL